MLSSYKKQLNLTAKDVMMRDYYENMQSLEEDFGKNFLKADRSNFTQDILKRLRLGRSADTPVDGAGDEYGNYKKFEAGANSVKEVNDKGYDDLGYETFGKNVENMYKEMNTPYNKEIVEGKHKALEDCIKKTVESTGIDDNNLMEKFLNHKEHIDTKEVWTKFKEEQEMLKDPDQAEVYASTGRLSPQTKEEIYRSYLTGSKVKDLSLKYGILPQRVKAVVYQKHLYWEEVYPRMGETHQRMAMELEMLYAREFPFLDYGLDLSIMADLEKGVRITRLSSVPTDTDKTTGPIRVPATIKEDTERYLVKGMRARQYDKVPIKFWGKGPGGFLLYDWVHHKGRGAPKLSAQARDLIRYHGTDDERRNNKELNKRMKLGGPRFAMMAQSTRRKGRSN